MSAADPMHRRALGKARMQAAIRWELRLEGVSFRCVPRDGKFGLEVRTTKGWRKCEPVHSDPMSLLRALVESPALLARVRPPPMDLVT